MKKIGGILRFLFAVIYVLNYALAAFIVNIFGSGEKYLKKRTGYGARRLMELTGSKITFSGISSKVYALTAAGKLRTLNRAFPKMRPLHTLV